MNELMLREMRSQASDLESARTDFRVQLRALRLRRPKSILLTGSGDSGYAAGAVEAAYASRAQVPVWAVPSGFAARWVPSRLAGLTVAISVSGEVRRTLEAAMSARNLGGQIVAVTADPSSRLAKLADATLLMPSPLTRSTPHTRDYTMTLLALMTLLEWVIDAPIPELDGWPRSVGGILEESLETATSLAEAFPDRNVPVWFLGMGPDRWTAAYGALKFWEAGGSAAWWDDLEEFGHGSQLASRPGQLAVVIGAGRADSRAGEMHRGLEQMGLSVATVGSVPPAGFNVPTLTPDLTPLVTCLPLQALAYAFASQRRIDVALPLGGDPLGEVYEEVHRTWMRESVLEPAKVPAPRE